MQWFCNMKISAKLVSSFCLMAIIAAVIGTLSVLKLTTLRDTAEEMYAVNTVPLSDLIDVTTQYQRMRVNVRELFIDRTQEDRQKHVALINELDHQIDVSMKKVDDSSKAPDIKKLVAEAQAALNNYDPIREKIATLLLSGKGDEAYVVLRDPANYQIAKAADDSISKLADAKIDDARKKHEMNNATSANAIRMTIGIVIAGVILAMVLGIFIARMISVPLRQGVDFSLAVADGDLTKTMTLNQKDEIGQLASAMNSQTGTSDCTRITLRDGLCRMTVKLDIFPSVFGFSCGATSLVESIYNSSLDRSAQCFTTSSGVLKTFAER